MHDVLAFSLLATAATAVAQTPYGPWVSAYSQASSALAKLSQQDKVNIVTGVGWGKGPCLGNTAAVSSIGYAELCLQDSPTGVRYANNKTVFPPGVQAASTWDLDLIRQRGQYLGAEFKGAGVNVLLGPVAGPLCKNAAGGRCWEGFGADQYLSGMAMAETIQAMQSSGVQACAKHFIGNEQETNRLHISANIDDRTLHELYMWPFADAIRANVASVMCSYNKVNGTYSCESDSVMNKLLKTELNFLGYIMSDWNAHHTTSGAANAGLDMSMPGTDFSGVNLLWGPNLTTALNSGQVPTSRLDDMVKRILASWYMAGQNVGYPSININASVQSNHKENARAVARDGIVLLKNDNGSLPLKKPTRLAVIGSGAVVNPDGPNACADRGCNKGALGLGWGSGTANYPYFVAPYDALNDRAKVDGTNISLSASDDTAAGANAAAGTDAALVFITADSGEEYITVEGNVGDRNNLEPWHAGNALVQAVAAVSKNVVVVVHSVGPVILETILAQPSVKAIVWAGLPAQESGNALVDILYGSTSPSGKLVYTIAKSPGDYSSSIMANGDDPFTEGLFTDYRHFDQANIAPRYEFGFGASYTTFNYSNIQATKTTNATAGPATGEVRPGGRADLFDKVAYVTATVTNTGSVAGAEVAQLYISLPDSVPGTPLRQLRGFTKLAITPGQNATAKFSLRRKDLSHWDVTKQEWILPSGVFTVSVGASSRILPLKATITI